MHIKECKHSLCCLIQYHLHDPYFVWQFVCFDCVLYDSIQMSNCPHESALLRGSQGKCHLSRSWQSVGNTLYVPCVFHELTSPRLRLLPSQCTLQLLLRWQSCPWIVLTGQISVPGYGMLMWQKSFIPCMRPNVCLWIVLKCKNILNHQNFINIFLSAKISSSIITFIEWIILLAECLYAWVPKARILYCENCVIGRSVNTRYYTSTVRYSCGKIFVSYLAHHSILHRSTSC